MRLIRVSSPAAALVATIVLPLMLFAVLGVQIARHRPPAFDERLIDYVDDHQYPAASRIVDVLLAIGGEPRALVPLALLIAATSLLFVTQRRGDALFFAAAVAGAVLFAPLLKLGFDRPPLQGDNSTRYFPSGHATGSIVVTAALVLISWQTRLRWAVLGIGLTFTLVYGAALVYSQGHYPSDVIGGWSVGLAWVAVLYAVRVKRGGTERARRRMRPGSRSQAAAGEDASSRARPRDAVRG